eukprot:GHVS01022022.1.p1 GENE.GHVS01022022.1~~GHVS01022022.1.p1  ORF type:complete len:436 (-),score=65.27 GHVS01022022.1:100-1311(-)
MTRSSYPPTASFSLPPTSYFPPTSGTGSLTPVPLSARSRPTPCPYPMPEAVNYSLSSRAMYGDSTGLGSSQYCYYGKDGSGTLRASAPVRFVSGANGGREPPTARHMSGNYVDTRYLSTPVPHYSGDSRLATPRQPMSRRLPSVVSLVSPPRLTQSSSALKRKKPASHRWDKDFDFAISDLFPCFADWFPAPPRNAAGGYADEAAPKRDGLLSRLLGKSCAIDGGNGKACGRGGYPRGMGESEVPGTGGTYLSDKAAHQNFVPASHPTVDTVCIQCGEILKSHPLDVDDAKVTRILQTEAGRDQINSGRKVGKHDLSSRLLNSVWEYSEEEEDDEEDKVPLPQFQSAPPRKFLKTPRSQKKAAIRQAEFESTSWAVPDELGGDVFPTDDCGKVALPAFPLTDR